MTLVEVILELADDMECEAGGLKDVEPAGYAMIRGYAKQLRIAAKVSAPPPPAVPAVPLVSAAVQHAQAIEAARAEFRGKVNTIPADLSRGASLEEGFDGSLVELVDSPDDPGDGVPTRIAFPPDAPVGAKTALHNGVYVLGEDRRLHYSAEETAKIKNQLQARPGSKLILG